MTNPELQLAEECVLGTGCHLFLTGRAGTGKTTFLRALAGKTPKRLIITAPTGVAAINAGGVTLHSFFQLPFGPFTPGSNLLDDERQRRFSKEKQAIIQSLQLLVIDEVSMVRADLLDGVDAVLRRLRGNSRPFGGVQLLLIGDLHQLPPVVKDEEWALLREFYQSPYFFNARALDGAELITIELRRVYRQLDDGFISLLNQVRENRLDAGGLAALNTRCNPGFTPAPDAQCITLCSHNHSAETINRARLADLPGKLYRLQAKLEGEFPEYAFPAPGTLELKKGAQVLFLRNDNSPEKRYFNGKIGQVSDIDGETVLVRCAGETAPIEVTPQSWDNLRYGIDPLNKEIIREKVGSFTQYPLKTAWAITIHKSQGLTFDRAIVDISRAFAPGQVYVALSRCRSLDGLVLSAPLSRDLARPDLAVQEFDILAAQNPFTPERLLAERIRFQQDQVLECFNYSRLYGAMAQLTGLLRSNARLVQLSGIDIMALAQRLEGEVRSVGNNFARQLHGLFQSGCLPESDPKINERVSKASAYFGDKLQTLQDDLELLGVETDNKEVAKRLHKAREKVDRELMVKLAVAGSCRQGFSLQGYLRALAEASAGDLSGMKGKNGRNIPALVYREDDVSHPELLQQLKTWRIEKASALGLPAFQILHQRVLVQIAVILPATMTELRAIAGIGKRTAERFGDELLAMVIQYREQRGITTVFLPERTHARTAKRPVAAGSTLLQSLALLKQGLNIEETARERNLTPGTIASHVAELIGEGHLPVSRFLDPVLLQQIEEEINRQPDRRTSELKQALGDTVSYADIHLALAHRKWRGSKDTTAS